MSTKSLYAVMRSLPGCGDKVRNLLIDLAPKVRSEPGNLRFVVYAHADKPDVFHVEETYRDEDAFRAHMESEHGITFNKAIETLVEDGASYVVFLKPVA